MRRWWTAGAGRLLFLALGTAVVVQQLAVGITEPELIGTVVVAMAGVLGYGADRRRESAGSSGPRSDGDGPPPASPPPESS
jgi:hypothetical protein